MSIESHNGQRPLRDLSPEERAEFEAIIIDLARANRVAVAALPPVAEIAPRPVEVDPEPEPEVKDVWYWGNRIAAYLLPILFLAMMGYGIATHDWTQDPPANPGLTCFGTGDARCGPGEPWIGEG